MTGHDDEKDVGHGRPPKSGRFKKGQSGNPRGRPRKKAKASTPLDPNPFRELLRSEGAREVIVNDASGRQTITAMQGVLRTLFHKAMGGGVLAQRTVMEWMANEAERHQLERKQRFDFWRDYKERYSETRRIALKNGQTIPEFFPHPDDIEFNWATLDVTFLGPMDEAHDIHFKTVEAIYDLTFEMMIFTDEDNRLPNGDGKNGKVGPYAMLHVMAKHILPPRLRQRCESSDRGRLVEASDRVAWRKSLQKRCLEAGIPFIDPRRGQKAPTMPWSKFLTLATRDSDVPVKR